MVRLTGLDPIRGEPASRDVAEHGRSAFNAPKAR